MARGPLGLILVLCFMAAGISGAAAQQNSPYNSPNFAQIQQLRQELEGLKNQLKPVNSQIQELVAEIKVLRQNERTIQEKMDTDRSQLRTLLNQHG